MAGGSGDKIMGVEEESSTTPVSERMLSSKQVPKRRRKIQGFDNVSVLSTEFMRRSLEDTSDLLRVVRIDRCSLLDIWRSNKRLRNDEIFNDSLLFSIPRHGFKCTEIVHKKKQRNADEEEEMNFMMMMVFEIVILGTRHHSNYLTKDFSMSANDVRYRERKSWMRRLLHGPTCKEQIRMTPQAFQRLCSLLSHEGGLIASRNVTIHEIVAQFLHILGHGSKNSTIKASFRRSGETISRQFHSVLRAVLNVGKLLIQQYDRENAPELVGREIEKWKWFQGAVGSIDGTFVELMVPAEDQSRYRNRKGQLCTNVLGVCDPNLKILYVLPGWEGSASDSRVLRSAINRPNGLRVYSDRYYLVDAGYTNGPGFLAPYRNTRYHLKLWRGNIPRNYKELFNLRHSSARNSIERTFGLLKKRWGILRTPSFYPLKTQIRIINACCILHNFLRDEMPDDELLDQVNREFESNTCFEDDFEQEVIEEQDESIVSVRVTNEWTTFRDNLAMQMFEDYQIQQGQMRDDN